MFNSVLEWAQWSVTILSPSKITIYKITVIVLIHHHYFSRALFLYDYLCYCICALLLRQVELIQKTKQQSRSCNSINRYFVGRDWVFVTFPPFTLKHRRSGCSNSTRPTEAWLTKSSPVSMLEQPHGSYSSQHATVCPAILLRFGCSTPRLDTAPQVSPRPALVSQARTEPTLHF